MAKLSIKALALCMLPAAFPCMNPPTVHAEDNKYLDLDLSQLMDVTITSAAKKPQKLADTAAAVYVITQEDIRKAGVTSIPDILAMAPGIQVSRINSSRWSVSSRGFGGFTSNKLLVMIDGRSVYTPAYSGTFWDMQHTMLEDIDRIEIIRGPGGTIWGANAVNGVINIITKKAQDTQGGLVSLGVGNQDRFTEAARYGGKLSETSYGRLYVMGGDRNSNELAGSGRDAYDGWQNIQGGFRADGNIGAKDEWNIQGDIYKNDGDQIVSPFWTNSYPYMSVNYGNISSQGENLIGRWQHTFDNADKLSFKAYYDGTDRDEVYYHAKFSTTDLDVQYEKSIGSWNNLTMGAGYRQVDATFENTFQVQIPDQTKDLYSLFAQDEIPLITETLVLTLGMKYEHNDYTGEEWQPSGRILYKPASNHSLWAAVGKAVRTPSMAEKTGAILFGLAETPYGMLPLYITGAPDFGSETVIAYEAGYRWQAQKNLSFDAAVYYNDYQDLYSTTYNLSSSGRPGLLISNAESGEGKGLELAANWQASPWLSFALTYTWQDLTLSWEETSAQSVSSTSISSVNYPKNQFSIRTTADFSENWQVNGWLRYVDEIYALGNVGTQNLIPVSDYFLLDMNIIWKPKQNLEIMLSGQNLLNNSQLEYISEFITPATEISRGVYLKATWKF